MNTGFIITCSSHVGKAYLSIEGTRFVWVGKRDNAHFFPSRYAAKKMAKSLSARNIRVEPASISGKPDAG